MAAAAGRSRARLDSDAMAAATSKHQPGPVGSSKDPLQQPVPFEYFVELLDNIAVISHSEWPSKSEFPGIDPKYRKELAALRAQALPKHKNDIHLAIRGLAVRELLQDWIKDLPAGRGPGPHACLPGTTEAVFRLLFPEEDVRRRYGIKETKMVRHLIRVLGVSYSDPAAKALFAWADSDAANGLTSGSGCLGIDFARQLRKLGHEDLAESSAEVSDHSEARKRRWGPLTVQSVDVLLDELASWSSFTHDLIRTAWDTSKSEAKEPATQGALNAKAEKPSRYHVLGRSASDKQLRILDPREPRVSRFSLVGKATRSEEAIVTKPVSSKTKSTNFELSDRKPSAESPRKARKPQEILDFLLSNAVRLRSRPFLVQIILQDLDPVLYPLPQDKETEGIVQASKALRQYNTKSVYKLSLTDVMRLWHPAMPDLWKYRHGDSFETVGREVERLGWGTAVADAKTDLDAMQVSTEIAGLAKLTRPELFAFVQMPKSIKATSCVAAAASLGHGGVMWAEQKYDGERFQAHVSFQDPARPEIKIFSKSQRDSTMDRKHTHAILLAALGRDPALSKHAFHSQLGVLSASQRSSQNSGSQSRLVKHSVILDAEMVAFSPDGSVAEFHKIFKIKDRAGVYKASSRGLGDREMETSLAGAERAQPALMEERFQYKARAIRHKLKEQESKRTKMLHLSPTASDGEDGEDDQPLADVVGVSQISDITVDGSFHLGLVFFDVLLLDGETLDKRPYEQRRAILENIIHPIPTFVTLAQRTRCDFGPVGHAQERRQQLEQQLGRRARPADMLPVLEKDEHWRNGITSLVQAFAKSHALRQEGLMLKAADGPYVGGVARAALGIELCNAHGYTDDDELEQALVTRAGDEGRGAWVKMKADYIEGLGDSVDMAVVGAKWSAKRGRELRIGTDAPTTFYLAARLPDRNGRPRLRCWATSEFVKNRQVLAKLVSELEDGVLAKVPFNYKNLCDLPYDLELSGTAHPSYLFPDPLLAEVLGGGFSKNAGDEFYMLRWPRIQKFHSAPDRTWVDAIGFDEFQRSAIKAVRRLETEVELEKAYEARAYKIAGREKLSWINSELHQRAKGGTRTASAAGLHEDLAAALDGESAAKKQKVAGQPDRRLQNLHERVITAGEMPAPAASGTDRSSYSDRLTIPGVGTSGPPSPPPSSPPPVMAAKDVQAGSDSGFAVTRPNLTPPGSGQARSERSGDKENRTAPPVQQKSPRRAVIHVRAAPHRTGTNIWDFDIPQPRVPARLNRTPGLGVSSENPAPAAAATQPLFDIPQPGPPSRVSRTPGQTASPKRTARTSAASQPLPATRPRTCTSKPRLLDMVVWFHPNVRPETADVLKVTMLQDMLAHSFDEIMAHLRPAGTGPVVCERPQLARSRSFSNLLASDNAERQRCAIVVMDASDADALKAVHEDIRQRVSVTKRRVATSMSAPAGLRLAGSSTPSASVQPRQCVDATSHLLASQPLIVVDISGADRLALEQWECVEQCSGQGPAAARGECECCPHADTVVNLLRRDDPRRAPQRPTNSRVTRPT